ncbi:MAG TPA: glycosyltransferase family 2 protein [Bacteroidetes bacterium]|nr:glycosyltransferase family 2 protein [Bacteroidota bacterium]
MGSAGGLGETRKAHAPGPRAGVARGTGPFSLASLLVPLSLLTLVRNRTGLLCDLLSTLARNPDPPREVIVGVSGGEDPRPHVPETPFPVHFLDVGSDGDRIRYSQARNACARAATSPHLLFLDADCLPAPGALAAFADVLETRDTLAIGEVRYLRPGTHDLADPNALRASSLPHPARPVPPASGWEPSDAYEMVWGLCIGIRRETFERLGGFDTSYGGYAGEDTDLAIAAREAGVPLAVVAATVFHQHHDVFEPPLQQVEATLANAQRFREKWGWWPMGGWLDAYARLGLVDWTPDAEHATLLRQPTAKEIESARHTIARPFRMAQA